MTDFLAKLVGRTLGTELSPRPVIAPMFAAGPMMVGEYTSEAVPQETLVGDSRSSLMPKSARLEQAELATRPQPSMEFAIRPQPSAFGRPTIREYVAQPVADMGIHQSDLHVISSHISSAEQPAPIPQQPMPGSITPRIQSDFSPPKESITLTRPQTNVQEERPGAHLVNSRRDSQPTSAAVPIIKVSIGRIDVRAVTPPAPTTTQKASSTRPQPSLEEYLQTRNRGKR